MIRPTHCQCGAPLPDMLGPGRPRVKCDDCKYKAKLARWAAWNRKEWATNPEYRDRRNAERRARHARKEGSE